MNLTLQNALSELLKTFGWSVMSKDVLSEKDDKALWKYGNCVKHDAKEWARIGRISEEKKEKILKLLDQLFMEKKMVG